MILMILVHFVPIPSEKLEYKLLLINNNRANKITINRSNKNTINRSNKTNINRSNKITNNRWYKSLSTDPTRPTTTDPTIDATATNKITNKTKLVAAVSFCSCGHGYFCSKRCCWYLSKNGLYLCLIKLWLIWDYYRL